MRIWDQIHISFANLWRRKLRTGLTVLGVVIGTVAIVVMLSIGIAQQQYLEQTIMSKRQMVEIKVYSMGGGYYGMGGPGTASSNNKALNQKTIDEIKALPHVKDVIPILDVNCRIKIGAYENGQSITAYPRSYLESLDWKFSEGSLIPPEEYASDSMPLWIGRMYNFNFYNPKDMNRFMSYGMPEEENAEPEVNLYTTTGIAIYDMDALYGSARSGSEGESTPPKPPKKYLIKADGVIDSGASGWSEWDFGAYTDLAAAESMLKRIFKGKAWPGQPATKSGRSTGEIVYSNLIVVADDMNYTQELTKSLQDLGLQAQSDLEWIQSIKEQSAQIQIFLGGIGGISLLVAAIGIANTMMMSIYERTKEIGIYKVLGCRLHTIRRLFLIESALIGFLGGSIGLGLSYLASYIMNNAAAGSDGGGMAMMMSGPGAAASVIPPWLSGSALVFAMLIGMLSGLLPAQRAMKLSPLEAIRNE